MSQQPVSSAQRPARGATAEPAWLRRLLIATAIAFLGLFLWIPLVAVFAFALEKGLGTYADVLADPATGSAIRLTLLATAVSVPVNIVFGLAAAWCVTKFRFRGRNLLITMIDLPFTVSPVISGLVFVLLFGSNTLLGGWLLSAGVRVVFAVPGIVLATMFVTFPFVARELIPLMESQGSDEEEAAMSLGASGWKTFFRVTIPRVKWALLHGIVLCSARAMGEFGAVSVVSGHIRGRTNTMPLHIEILYNEYNTAAAFAVASMLASLSLVTLAIKHFIEWQAERDRRRHGGT